MFKNKTAIYIVILLFILLILLIFSDFKTEEEVGWVKKFDMPTARHSLAVTSLNGKIYAIGGIVREWYHFFERIPTIKPFTKSPVTTNIVEIYDPVKDIWETGKPMPTARNNLGTITLDNKIYAIGGSNGTSPVDVVEIYDPVKDMWETGKPMPTPRETVGIVILNNKIYVIGGYAKDIGFTNVVEIYDPVKDMWETGKPMPTPRSRLAATTLNNKIYVIGGYLRRPSETESAGIKNIVEIYDPETDTWTTGKPMPTARRNLATTTLNNKIYVIGGFGPPHDAVEIYDPVIDTWETGKPLSYPRYELGVTTLNNKIYAIGGLQPIIIGYLYIHRNIVEEYSP